MFNSMKRRIFVFGGRGRHEVSDVVMCYSVGERSWTRLEPMSTGIEFPVVAPIRLGKDGTVGWKMRICGGAETQAAVVAAMRTVAALTHFPPGLLPLIDSFLGPDSILVVGARGDPWTRLPVALWYSVETDTWRTDVPPMTSMVIGHYAPAGVAVDGRMIVLGGSTCEAFDSATKSWSMLSPMTDVRFHGCAVAWQGRACRMLRSSDESMVRSCSNGQGSRIRGRNDRPRSRSTRHGWIDGTRHLVKG